MTQWAVAGFVYCTLCLVLVGSALVARRLPANMAIRMAIIWAGIFGLIYVLFLFFGAG